MKRMWKEVPRDGTRAQWAGIYVTLNSKGVIVMNRSAHEKLDNADAFLLLYDSANNAIGLMPASSEMPNAYPAFNSGKHGGKKINAYCLLAECGIVIKDTLEFPDAEIDPDGILILNLRTARTSNRAINHPTRRTEKAEI